ncbi:MAG: hypothetical protein HUJ22_01360 [Gracilimonas sp.]|uniref:hypothetical protein n=1 Tax=Gracilimonas sp. TaxID=1974203 RepID=UPI0019BCEAC6|nr:hypothetical protein [Gracilimonas sp.]MBD3615190.1 hypothetical protein [Gracilimonas sp.]
MSSVLVIAMAIGSSVSAQKTVWRANDIDKIEIQTLYDIFSLTSDWSIATNDDATIQFARSSLAGPGGAWWPVYINGVQIHLQSWNSQSLYLLPVSISQIDSVVIVEKPMLYEGEFTEKGGIFIYTKNGREGLQAQANLALGNKSGDPGPFVYTDLASRNIERLGPVADALISYRDKKYGVQAGFKQFVHAVTDALEFRRLTPFEFGAGDYRHEKIISTSAFVKGDITHEKFTHRLQLGATETADFLYTDLYGTEIPVDRKWGFLSLDGAGEVAENRTIDYGISYNVNHIKEYPNKENRWLRWEQQVLSGTASYTHNFEKGIQKVGLKADLYELEDESSSGKTLNGGHISVYHLLKYKLAEKLTGTTNLTLVNGSNMAAKVNAGLQTYLNNTQVLSFEATYSQRLPEEDNSLWYWMGEKGFGSDTLATYQPGELPKKSVFMQLRLGWEMEMSNRVRLNIATAYSRSIDEYIFDYELESNGQRIQTGAFNFIPNLQSSFITVPVKINMHLTPSIRQTLSYTMTRQLSGEEALFDMIPQHRVTMNLNFKPVDSFKLWTRIQAQSKSRWALAEQIDGMEVRINPLQTEIYEAESAPRLQWDMGIKKYFWQQRFAFSLDMQNITNQKFRVHPISHKHAFTVFLGMHLSLD